MSWRVGIVGHQGYGGAELVRILRHHPAASDFLLLDHRESAEPSRYVRPSKIRHIPASEQAVRDASVDVVFLATPHEASIELAPAMLAAGARVIDLSGAFRLRTPERYLEWYGSSHAETDLLATAVYGLPEFYRDQISAAQLVANPGCYPTAANLAIRPLIEHQIADRAAGIVCDAKSGVSGAGRKPSLKTSFCEVTGNFSAYSVLQHRHVPEVLMNSGLEERELSFTAQLIPVDRGILETIYFRSLPGVTAGALDTVFRQCYEHEPFVRLHSGASRPDLHDVAHTNFCDISYHLDEKTGRGLVISAIDNLGKGAAGQAIQNMNLLLGLPETEGLL